MRTRMILPLLLLAGCAMFSSTATPEDKLAEARDYLELAKPIAQAAVDAGKIKQSEMDIAFAALESGILVYAASLNETDAEAQAKARASVFAAIGKVAALLLSDERAPTAPEDGA